MNYFYNGQAISRDQFLSGVPANWQDDLDELGNYSYGYFTAIKRD